MTIEEKKLQDPQKTPANTVSFICGLLAVLTAGVFYLSLPLGILGIVFGAQGVKKSGSKLAKAGLILAIIGLSLTVLIYLVLIGLIFFDIYG